MATPPLVIETDRLKLVPCPLDGARCATSDPKGLGGLIHARIADGWPSKDLRDALPIYARQLEADPSVLGWGIWLILDLKENMLAGDVGFKGLPDSSGTVEIGYGIAPVYRLRGFATEAARGVVGWGFAHQEVRRIIAECLTDNLGSIRVLERLGMKRLGSTGNMLRWELWKPP